jgi:DNA-binding response OmpR family regulator
MKYKVAFIEDDGMYLRLCKYYTELLDAEAICFSSPLTFINKAQMEDFDLIITDNQMPDYCGTTLARLIKEKGIKTPIVLSSIEEIDEFHKDELKYVDDFILKESLIENIQALINKWCTK